MSEYEILLANMAAQIASGLFPEISMASGNISYQSNSDWVVEKSTDIAEKIVASIRAKHGQR